MRTVIAFVGAAAIAFTIGWFFANLVLETIVRFAGMR